MESEGGYDVQRTLEIVVHTKVEAWQRLRNAATPAMQTFFVCLFDDREGDDFMLCHNGRPGRRAVSEM